MTRALILACSLFACGGSPSTSTTPAAPAQGGGPSATPAAMTQPKPKGELDKLMRTRMNKAYTQLVFYVLDSASDVDFAKIEHETQELLSAVGAVRGLPTPSMVQSAEALEVYKTYNDVLQRDADKFNAAVKTKERPQMEGALTKIGKTCNDCHRFFRVEVKDEKK
jgi:hypothetical protein